MFVSLNDTTTWQYADFIPVGYGPEDKMAFQTLLNVTGSVASPVPTSEEEDYAYDTSGRVESAAFAQTPATGFTPGSGQRWYSASEEPASRCREFDFDPDGRNLNLQYMWEMLNPTSTSPTSASNITGWNNTYENSGQARGLKLTSSLYNGSGTSWNLDHTENYGYEAQRAFLTSAHYNDGQPNASPTWTYWSFKTNLGKLFTQEAKILSLPEEKAAEDSDAGPAVLAAVAEEGALLGEMKSDEMDETFSDGGGI